MNFDLGSALSGGLQFITGMFNREADSDWRNQQMQMARQQEQLQREFAQSGIQWRVADAQKAGLHPLAALGNQGVSFSPVSMGDGGGAKWDFGNMGQDIGRALKSAMSAEDRDEKEMRDLTLERAKLQNDVLRQELNSKAMRESRQGGQIGPQMPTGPSWNSILGHLSRSPDRGAGSYPVGEKEMESQPEATLQARKSYIGGVPVYHAPTTTLAGQNAEDRYGENHPITRAAGYIAAADDVRRSLPYWARDIYQSAWGGSGQRIKRFRRGGGSYRPWAD